MRGPKPKSGSRRALEGSGRKINAAEPHPPPPSADFDAVPRELAGHADAAAAWREIVPLLRACGQVSLVDRPALVALAWEWGTYRAAMRAVQAEGMIHTSRTAARRQLINAHRLVARQALAACLRLWPELGLTPSSRTRLQTVPLVPGADAFAEFDVAPSVHDPQ